MSFTQIALELIVKIYDSFLKFSITDKDLHMDLALVESLFHMQDMDVPFMARGLGKVDRMGGDVAFMYFDFIYFILPHVSNIVCNVDYDVGI